MSIVNEMRLSVSRTINLGNYESTKIEVGVTINRNDDSDNETKMRATAIDELWKLLNEAMNEFGPDAK